MPRLKLTLPPPSTPWTKVPNVLFDKVIPHLKDTELRILLILIRQTSGWHRDNQTIMLTYRTLMARSGRGHDAVSRALRTLRDLGLIHKRRSSAQRATANSELGLDGNRTATIDRKN